MWDRIIRRSYFIRTIKSRGSHRLRVAPSAGTALGFMTLIFFIRITANILMIINLARHNVRINFIQNADIHFLLLSAYLIWIVPLTGYQVSGALPSSTFIELLPGGKRFISRFRIHITFMRPVPAAIVFLILFISVSFSLMSRRFFPLIIRTSVVITVAFSAVALLLKVYAWLKPSVTEAQMLHMLFLFILVFVNPDISPRESGIITVVGNRYYELMSIRLTVVLIGVVILSVLILICIIKITSLVSDSARRRFKLSPVEEWYWKIVKFRSWIIIYFLSIPVLFLKYFSLRIKLYALVFLAGISFFSFLAFAFHCDNVLREKWQFSIMEKNNRNLLLKPLLTHLFLTSIPFMSYFTVRMING